MRPHLTAEQFEEFAPRFPHNAMVLVYVHKNPVSYRGASRWYAYEGKPIDDMPKPAALKLLRQLNHLSEELIARLGRPLLKK